MLTLLLIMVTLDCHCVSSDDNNDNDDDDDDDDNDDDDEGIWKSMSLCCIIQNHTQDDFILCNMIYGVELENNTNDSPG